VCVCVCVCNKKLGFMISSKKSHFFTEFVRSRVGTLGMIVNHKNTGFAGCKPAPSTTFVSFYPCRVASCWKTSCHEPIPSPTLQEFQIAFPEPTVHLVQLEIQNFFPPDISSPRKMAPIPDTALARTYRHL
jgi:hypothetical protein